MPKKYLADPLVGLAVALLLDVVVGGVVRLAGLVGQLVENDTFLRLL